MELSQKVVLLTGASRGIGRALARTLAEDGARLVLSARSRAPLEELAAELAQAGAEAEVVVGDVGQDRDARRMADTAHEAFGRVDVLVNNAAVLPDPAPVVDVAPETWEDTLRVNVIGTVNLIRHVLPGMQARTSGVIVNVSSGWGRFAEADVGPYCASKFAVEAVSQTVAAECGPGVVVFALNPGIIATDMLERAFQRDVSSYPSPEDLAPAWRRLFADLDPSWNGTSRNL